MPRKPKNFDADVTQERINALLATEYPHGTEKRPEWKLPSDMRTWLAKNQLRDEFRRLRAVLEGQLHCTPNQSWHNVARHMGSCGWLDSTNDLVRWRLSYTKALKDKRATALEEQEWVARMLAYGETLTRKQLCEAPSLGSVSMLEFARANRDKFFAQRIQGTKAAIEREGKKAEGDDDSDRDNGIDLIDRILGELAPAGSPHA